LYHSLVADPMIIINIENTRRTTPKAVPFDTAAAAVPLVARKRSICLEAEFMVVVELRK